MWNLRVDHHFHGPACTAQPCDALASIRAQLTSLKALIMSNQTQLAADINAVAANVAKIGGETRTLLDKIAELQAVVDAAGDVSPEVVEAMAALAEQVGVVDALVPDAEAPAP